MSDRRTELELLAPARNVEIGRQAIIHGADAVYIGAESFGARAAAGNSVEDIAGLVSFAHRFDARVYVTLNTLIYDSELRQAEALIRRLYSAGVDALIVQDMSVLRMDIPPVELHASTQCDTRTPEKARFLQAVGFSQIVLARELSLDEIKRITAAVTVPVEVFVHGALCVSYSGDCQASLLATGRSANRGECAQMCRLRYELCDGNGRKIAPDAHYLSLRDMNRLDRLADLADAGVRSFKIEGRLKDRDYVCMTTAAYSQALDSIVEASPQRYSRSSSGKADYNFTPDVNRIFNRRFSHYFLDGRPAEQESMASLDTPKWIGLPVGKVVSVKGRSLKVKTDTEIANGDGLGYFDRQGLYCGFRVNRSEGNVLYAASDVQPPVGATLYRNRDKKFDDAMSGATACRTIPLTARLRRVDGRRIALAFCDALGRYAEVTADADEQPAKTPQLQARERIISRLGDTVYSLSSLEDTIGDDSFVAASLLTDLRRRSVAALDAVRKSCYRYGYRRDESAEAIPFTNVALDRHHNVANRLARKFYADHGMEVSEAAAEVSLPGDADDHTVMTTRYCLRRELGACLKTKSGSRLQSHLFLRSSGVRYRLDFDCAACCMKVVVIS